MPATARLPARRAKPEVIDTDIVPDEDVSVDDYPTTSHTIDEIDETFELYLTVNAFNALAVTAAEKNDVGPMYNLIINLIRQDQRPRFRNSMARHPNMTGEDLGKIFEGMLEAVANPTRTRTSSGSRSTRRKAAGTKPSRAK